MNTLSDKYLRGRHKTVQDALVLRSYSNSSTGSPSIYIEQPWEGTSRPEAPIESERYNSEYVELGSQFAYKVFVAFSMLIESKIAQVVESRINAILPELKAQAHEGLETSFEIKKRVLTGLDMPGKIAQGTLYRFGRGLDD